LIFNIGLKNIVPRLRKGEKEEKGKRGKREKGKKEKGNEEVARCYDSPSESQGKFR
jgi:hypothetical protein